MLQVVSDQITIGLAERADLRDQFAAALDDSSAWVIHVVLVVFLLGMIAGTTLARASCAPASSPSGPVPR